jgi:hypothetical protein
MELPFASKKDTIPFQNECGIVQAEAEVCRASENNAGGFEIPDDDVGHVIRESAVDSDPAATEHGLIGSTELLTKINGCNQASVGKAVNFEGPVAKRFV